jgi:2-polyprenyl-3-methyl-5-hydroxy-6-metoxy-1,4-benzoquinol methylase
VAGDNAVAGDDQLAGDSAKIAELTAIVEAVRERVRARYPEPGPLSHPSETNGTGHRDASPNRPPVRVSIADLMPIVHARDAAQAKIASIGSVNPRRGGFLNNAIQYVKKTVARALQWFVRDQISFNRETVSALEAVIEALNDHNRILVSLAAQTTERIASVGAETNELSRHMAEHLSDRVPRMIAEVHTSVQNQLNDVLTQVFAETRELKDIRLHWQELRADWDRKVATNEIQFLRSVADLQGANQHRATLMESNFRETVASQHKQFEAALERANLDIQRRLWADMRDIREQYERLIHSELHLIRQRAAAAAQAIAPAAPVVPAESNAPNFDYGRFAERFRGSEEYISRNVAFYKPFFAGRENVLDIGCGRGEFLESMRESGVPAKGIDLSEESVALCAQKGLSAQAADLFLYLASQPEQEFDGIFSSQVVEHLDPRALPEMIRLCASRLRRGGVLAIETPNPECLAIFATHFYLDPTHTRPVPHPLLAFYMEEAGLGQIEVHELSPAVETMPELASLPEDFRKKFFGGLDYAIVGCRL